MNVIPSIKNIDSQNQSKNINKNNKIQQKQFKYSNKYNKSSNKNVYKNDNNIEQLKKQISTLSPCISNKHTNNYSYLKISENSSKNNSN